MFFGFLYMRQTGTAPGEEGEGTNFISQFNPFGNGGKNNPDDDTTPPVDVSGYEPHPEDGEKLQLIKVSSVPVAGFSVFQKERLKEVPTPAPLPPPAEGDATPAPPATTTKPTPPQTEFMPALRYVERATGNVYQTFADNIEERKFSGTEIPKVYEAFFGNKGDAVVMRYLKSDVKTIQTFWGLLPKEVLGGDSSSEIEIRGTFLPDNIQDISMSPDAQSIFYLFNVGEGTIGTVLNLSTGTKMQIFDSAFTEWLSWWPNSKMITLTTKPSSVVAGYMYKIDPATKNFSQVLGNVNGLTTLTSPDGKMVLYGDNNLSLRIYTTDTKETTLLGVRTLPEKCVWGKGSDFIYCSVPKSTSPLPYPDAWYQGEVSFNDQIWKIDVAAANAEIIADISALSEGEEVDGIKLALDEKEGYLFFVNKKDSFLWELRLR